MEQQLSVAPLRDLAPAVVEPRGNDYVLNIGNTSLEIKREIDFGVIPGLSKPCLFKAGAEKIITTYGIQTSFSVESAIEQFGGIDADGKETAQPFFYYRVKCSCDYFDGHTLHHITDGMGSANTREKQCGRASSYDTANARLKIAKKRALVDAALLIGRLSSMFAQDIENEDFVSKGVEKISKVSEPDSLITAKQMSRIYAIAGSNGFSKGTAKKLLEEAGFASTKDIKQKDYDKACALFQSTTERED